MAQVGGGYSESNKVDLTPSGGTIFPSFSIARLADGGLVSVVTKTDGVYVSRFDASGGLIAAEQKIVDATLSATVTGLTGGGYAIAWWNNGPSVSDSAYVNKVQVFDVDGRAVSPLVGLEQAPGSSQFTPALAALPNGGFTTAWSRSDLSVAVRTFDGTGNALTGDTSASAPMAAQHKLVGLADDQVLVVSTLRASDGSSRIEVRNYDPSTGTAGPDPIKTIAAPGASIVLRDVVRLASGDSLIVWLEQTGAANLLKGEILEASGASTGREVSLQLPNGMALPAISAAALDDGKFVILYDKGLSQTPTVTGQVYDAAALPVGEPFIVSTPGIVNDLPSVAPFGSNDFAVVWRNRVDSIASPDASLRFYFSPISGTEAGETLSGTAYDDVIPGLGGDDALLGLGGNDLLIGGAGRDRLDGGAGLDTASYVDSDAAVSIDLALGTASGGEAEGDTLVSIENLVGSALADTLSGDAGVNRLEGGDGDDRLAGRGGSDILVGGNGRDLVSYQDSSSGVTVSLALGTGRGGDAEGDVLIDIEDVVGSAYADVLIGDGGDNALNGGVGDDRLVGGAGADSLDGGAGTDTANYSTSGAGITIDLLGGIATGGDATGDRLSGIENLVGSAFGDNLTGDDAANRLEGGAGADRLSGGAGRDTLIGGAGTDTFVGTAAGLNGDTIVDLEAGERIVITDAAIAGFTATLSGNAINFTGGSLTLSERPTGNLVVEAAAQGGVELSFAVPATSPPAVRDDFNGDGRSDILWRNTDGSLSDWLGRANGGFAANDANAFRQVPTDWQVAGTIDVNGDGRWDIVWRSKDGGFSNWLGTASGGFTQNDAVAFSRVPTDWQVVGTGDFNGDGRGDVLWRNAGGALSDWLGTANGGFIQNDANALRQVSTDWKVVGTGDFNGDGRDDILWRNVDGRLSDWLGTASGGFVQNDANALARVDTSWIVAGTGDFNGDGRDDIVWRNTDGALSDWLGQADGGFATNDVKAFTRVPGDWRIVATGDYNGDGKDDLLWRNSDGSLSDWLGTATGGFAQNDVNAFATVPTGWHVQPEPLAFG